jgi:CHAD domain-containing protein
MCRAHNRPKKNNVHQLRITVRRMQSIVWVINHSEPRQCRHFSKHLKSFIRELNKIREIGIAPATYKMKHRIVPWLQRTRIRDRELHTLRVITKKTRYALETIGRPSTPLKNLQRRLGRVHDYEVLCTLLKEKKRIENDLNRSNRAARILIRPALKFAIRHL